MHDFRVFEPETCDGRTTVRVVCTRVWGPYDLTVVPDDTRYLTITCNGAMLYDSRSDVPVDLEKWAMTWAAHHHHHRRH